MKLPAARLRGTALAAARALASHSTSARLLRAAIEPQMGIDRLARLPSASRGALPFDAQPLGARPPRTTPRAVEETPAAATGTRALVEQFRAGTLTPDEAARQAIARLRAHAPGSPMTLFDEANALHAAAAATARYREGRALGPLDGVPLVVKEQLDMAGLPTHGGARSDDKAPATEDATVVARLRQAGAVLLGHSAMTEYGLSPLGANVHRSMPRNPHDAGHLAGGSSTGSAVAVAAGYVPLAVGADGGGSIRIPSALCGVYGLKPTFGRVSRAGDAYSGTMDHVGPIAATVEDLGHLLDAVAATPDPRDPATRYAAVAPAPLPGELALAARRSVAGLRVGLLLDEHGTDEQPWSDASPAVAAACRRAVDQLAAAGATLVPLRIPLAPFAPAIGYLSIGLEALADLRFAFDQHREALGADVVCLLGALSTFSSDDYLDAQRLRTTLRRQIADAFRTVDLLALPTVATAAPPVTDDEMARGFLDGAATHAMCRYAMLGNLTGLPAGTAPVGKDGRLPVALQLIGDAWDEGTVLAGLAKVATG